MDRMIFEVVRNNEVLCWNLIGIQGEKTAGIAFDGDIEDSQGNIINYKDWNAMPAVLRAEMIKKVAYTLLRANETVDG